MPEDAELIYCRKCMKHLSPKEFYESVDAGFIDTNAHMSVCKNCIQNLYNEVFDKTNSLEKTVHKLCTSLNVRFSNEAISATKAHIETLLKNGKNVNAIFSVYKMKLTATKKSMDKSGVEDMTYEDVGTIYTSETFNAKEIPIPQEVVDFWSKGSNNFKKEDIEYLEMEYANFKQTHKADTYAEIVLLKQVCYTLLNIKQKRENNDDTKKEVEELQNLMKNLAIAPGAKQTSGGSKTGDTFGLWIQDIEKQEPAQWLKTDPRGDMYRDVGNVEEYFQKYFVRPLKNFITGSKDFSLNEEDDFDDIELDEEDADVLQFMTEDENPTPEESKDAKESETK